jgi:hypothetical protein
MLIASEARIAIQSWYSRLGALDRHLLIEAAIGHDPSEVELRLGLPAGAFAARLLELQNALAWET